MELHGNKCVAIAGAQGISVIYFDDEILTLKYLPINVNNFWTAEYFGLKILSISSYRSPLLP